MWGNPSFSLASCNQSKIPNYSTFVYLEFSSQNNELKIKCNQLNRELEERKLQFVDLQMQQRKTEQDNLQVIQTLQAVKKEKDELVSHLKEREVELGLSKTWMKKNCTLLREGIPH